MVLLIYEQIWAMSLWLEQPLEVGNLGEIKLRFNLIPQIHDLIEQGFEPSVARHYDVAADNMHFILTFEVPEAMRTWITLKYPEPVEDIDFDDMITIRAKQP